MGFLTESSDSPGNNDGECRIPIFLQHRYEFEELCHRLEHKVSISHVVSRNMGAMSY